MEEEAAEEYQLHHLRSAEVVEGDLVAVAAAAVVEETFADSMDFAVLEKR